MIPNPMIKVFFKTIELEQVYVLCYSCFSSFWPEDSKTYSDNTAHGFN